jgi:methionyl-tRNA formyltransferase
VTDTGPGLRPVRTVFLGSGRFGIPSLRCLTAMPDIDPVGVVTAPPRPAGRRGILTPTPVADAARALGIAVILTPERLRASEAVAAVLALRPELLILADYGQIVPAALLGVSHGALNLHPSLLPRHRGATPIPAAILADDRETGVSLMQMDEGLDTGPIVAQSHEPLDGTETAPDLEDRLAEVAAGLLAETVGPWLRGARDAVSQPAIGATVTRPLRREDGRLEPDRPAVELERQVRAYVPWPGTFIETPGSGRLIVESATAIAAEPGDVGGRLVADGDGLALTTRQGRLRLARVRPAGRTSMTAAELRRGAPDLVGSIVR